MKNKETLEEVAERLYPENWESIMDGQHDSNSYERTAFINGAKWQAERMYSEGDMIDFAFNTYYYISGIMNVPFNKISENKIHAIDNFEQFKKK